MKNGNAVKNSKKHVGKQWIPKTTKDDQIDQVPIREKTPSLSIEKPVDLPLLDTDLTSEPDITLEEQFPPLTADKTKSSEKGKIVEGSSASHNRFTVLENLDTVNVGESMDTSIEISSNPPKRVRAASARIAEVMKQVKTQRKSPTKKTSTKAVRTKSERDPCSS
ncbi:DNA primase large subunit [Corchorus olitorius]|uniref:DNA primase large subunit n=1 Tax=Corchorus olitorius TaxID=93759 RepID=A0A1R3KDV1_9ROSI|nr:DNA primase large subunit [Corchorus olitorius]